MDAVNADIKHNVRKSAILARSVLSERDVRAGSSQISEKLMALECVKKSRLIMCYLDFRKEVMTGEFIERCIEQGKKVAVPVIIPGHGKRKDMKASQLLDLEKDLEKGNYGILEPKKESMRIVDPMEIDICVVPGVAFDCNRNRMGYGAGYYDRFLKDVRTDCIKIGIAFEMQLLQEIPVDKNDVMLDMIITEKRIL